MRGYCTEYPFLAELEKKLDEKGKLDEFKSAFLSINGEDWETVRDVFIIDPSGRIKAIITVPVTTGKNTDQLIRILDSIQLQETYGFQTPAGWNPGEPVLLPNVTSYEELINRINNQETLGYYCPAWYVCYTNFNTESVNNATPPQVDSNVTPSHVINT